MMLTSKPLRRSRVEVFRLTSATEPSNGTLWMKTNAFCPGSALMSGNTFSLVSYRMSPSWGLGMSTVFVLMRVPPGMGCDPGVRIVRWCRPSDGRALRLLRCVPGLPVAARHREHHLGPQLPGQLVVHRDVDLLPELVHPAWRWRQRRPAPAGDLDLSGRQQLFLRDRTHP